MKERGIAHIFLIILLLIGLAVGVYLVQQKTNILPKAYETGSPDQVPDNPVDLEGTCNSSTNLVKLKWKYDPSYSTGGLRPVTYWYIRYRKPNGEWWPKTVSAQETDKSRIKVDGNYTGAGVNEIEMKLEQSQQSLGIWGVYACNGPVDKSVCSDFIQGPVIPCLPAVTIIPTASPTETPAPTPTSTLTPSPTPVARVIKNFQYICNPGNKSAYIVWEAPEESTFWYGFNGNKLIFIGSNKSLTSAIEPGKTYSVQLAFGGKDESKGLKSAVYNFSIKCPKSN